MDFPSVFAGATTLVSLVDQVTRTVGSVKSVFERIDSTDDPGLKAEVERLQSLVLDIQKFAIEAQSFTLLMQTEYFSLQQEYQKLLGGKPLRSSYKIHKFETGGHALRYSGDVGEPEHYACQICINDGVSAILEDTNDELRCPKCSRVVFRTDSAKARYCKLVHMNF